MDYVESDDLSSYEVVQSEMFHSPEVPQLTFSSGRFHVNRYCIGQFPTDDYVQILVSKEKKSIVLLPGTEKRKDSLRWVSGEKRKPRNIGSDVFFYLVFHMIQWDFYARYRIDGEIRVSAGEKLVYFPLEKAICFLGKTEDGTFEKRFPKDWKKRFGTTKSDEDDSEPVKTYEHDAFFEVELPFRRDVLKRMQEKGMSDQDSVTDTHKAVGDTVPKGGDDTNV